MLHNSTLVTPGVAPHSVRNEQCRFGVEPQARGVADRPIQAARVARYHDGADEACAAAAQARPNRQRRAGRPLPRVRDGMATADE